MYQKYLFVKKNHSKDSVIISIQVTFSKKSSETYLTNLLNSSEQLHRYSDPVTSPPTINQDDFTEFGTHKEKKINIKKEHSQNEKEFIL